MSHLIMTKLLQVMIVKIAIPNGQFLLRLDESHQNLHGMIIYKLDITSKISSQFFIKNIMIIKFW